MKLEKLEELINKASEIRSKIIDIAYRHQSGHVGSCLSCVEIMTYLYYHKMKDGDIFILSKGHAALTQYCILNDLGLISNQEIQDYPTKLGIHPELDRKRGIYASTGSLGHGLGIAMGYALANPDINVYVLCGDGETNEGSFHEVLQLKQELNIENLVIIVDCNGLKGFGPNVWPDSKYDGHSFHDIDIAIAGGRTEPMTPLRTTKGRGLGRFENELGSHYFHITKEDYDEYKTKIL